MRRKERASISWNPRSIRAGMSRKQRRKRKRPSAGRGRTVKAKRRESRWRPWLAALAAIMLGMLLILLIRNPDDPLFEPTPEPQDAERLAAGQVLYADHCASCHGSLLEGQPNWRESLPDGRFPAPPHDESGHTWHHSDDYLFSTTKLGGQATAPVGYLSAMPGFEGTLSDDDIWMVLDFIKSRWPAEIRARQRDRSH